MGNPITGTSATITGLDASTTYEFQVRAVNADGESGWSATLPVTTDAHPPVAPVNFQSPEQGMNSVTLTWDSQTGLTGYTLEYKVSGTDDWKTWTAPGVAATSVTITGLTANTLYEFRLSAINTAGEESSETTATTKNIPAADPVKPKVKVDPKKATISSVTLTFMAPNKTSTLDSNADYIITCITPGITLEPSQIKTSSTGAIISGLQPGKTYKFSVTAVNADGTEATDVNVTAKTPKYVAPKMKADTKGMVVTGGDAKGRTATTIDSVTLTWATAGRPEGENLAVKVIDAKTKQEVTANLGYNTGTDKKGNALTTLTITGLKASTKYTVEVQAYTGESLETATHKTEKVAKVSITTLKYPDAKFKQDSFSPTELVLNVTLPKNPIAGAYEAFQLFDSSGTLVTTASGDAVALGKVTFTGADLMAGKYTVKAVILDELGNVLQSTKGAKITLKAV